MALTIRERYADGRGVGAVGTLHRPKPLPVKLDDPRGYSQRLQVRLGFEAIPSTQFWDFRVERDAEIRVRRLSSDPYAVHVAVALLGPNDHLGDGRTPLVHTAGGRGEWKPLSRGRWWIVVACGLPIQIEVELEVEIRPRWQVGTAVVIPIGIDTVATAQALRRPAPLRSPYAALKPRPLRAPITPATTAPSLKSRKLRGST